MKIISAIKSCIAVSLLLSSGISFAQGTPIIDINNSDGRKGSFPIGFSAYQQTFNTQTSGQLSGMELFANSDSASFNGTMSFKLQVGESNTWYNGSWNADMMTTAKNGKFSIDLSNYGIHVNSGDAVMFQVQAQPGYTPIAVMVTWESIGTLLEQNRTSDGIINGSWPTTERSIAFNSFVIPDAISPVPEPGTYAMLLAGLMCTGFALRKKKAMQT
ncbi:PEP-CTERM sorting domain-containing protein [Janthinobacterium lividum]|uniref:PEP-CTERM sorting domain-containing protein n=1 Tax=Janthinobacterium lividum TaxID=29581 RepID=UPI000446A310|nr:PEP-CTERM sorting domain-containing protein [Janthinobacterium lividum]EZP36690.1 PEP-CTERM motif-containing protein [Janthinobacterium lividum]